MSSIFGLSFFPSLMNNSRTTPRTNKARDALRQAMIELLVEKPYGDIRVQDIAQRAGISRSSFYVYFRDKDDLLISGFEEIGVTSYDDLFEVNDNDPYYPNFAIV